MPDISAIVVTYNSAGVVEPALTALLSEPDVAACYVVDNASMDGTCDLIRRKFPAVKLIVNTENLGFGAANNLALEQVTTPYALLLNPDAVPEPGAVTTLLAAAERYPEAAIVAPLIHTPEREVWPSFKWDIFKRERHKATWQVPEGDVSVDWASGAALLLNMKPMRAVGFFDQNIFLYHEDDDMCLRVRRAGHGIVVAPEAVVVHVKDASSSGSAPEREAWKWKQFVISRLYLERKYHGAAAAARLAAEIRTTARRKMLWYGLLCNRKKRHKYAARFQAAGSASVPVTGDVLKEK